MPERGRRSYVWRFFTEKKEVGVEEDEIAQKVPHCDLCGAAVTKTDSNTSGLINHLKRVHNKGDPNKCRRELSDDDDKDGGDRPPPLPGSILKKQLKRMRE